MVNALLLHPYKFRSLDTLVRVWEDRGTDTSFDARDLAPGDAEDMRAGTDQFESWPHTSTKVSIPPWTAAYKPFSAAAFLRISLMFSVSFRCKAGFFPLPNSSLDSTRSWSSVTGSGSAASARIPTLSAKRFNSTAVPTRSSESCHRTLTIRPRGTLGPACALSRGTIRPRESLLEALARLKPGVRLSQARDSLTGVTLKLQKIYPKTNSNRSANLSHFARSFTSSPFLYSCFFRPLRDSSCSWHAPISRILYSLA